MLMLFLVFFGDVTVYFTCAGVWLLVVVQRPTVEVGYSSTKTVNRVI